ncbi:hypothetical protein OG379_22210 [Streptomyces sp. NBC_01166]|uniref:hypothetical protein n=1 Tax=Streptomyces sp. NBC_01166 TaxID=2903755 RepID=UPI00386A6C19|nr:hypothetical protein OG379_22210 [Streptomyces sp. NBC_01166]
MTAAVITAAATIIAAVIAAVAVSGGDPPPPTASAAGPAGTSTAASASTEPSATPSESSVDPSDPPLQTLPAGQATATPHGRPRLTAVPDRAPAGTVVTLKATGFAPDERIRITFRDSGFVEKDLRDVTAGPDGSFAAEVHVPSEEGNGSETPTFRVWSLDDVDTDNQADTPFTVIE